MSGVLLDTHAWIWWLSSPELLSETATKAVREAVSSGAVHVSSMSAWEVTMLVKKSRLRLRLPAEDWIARSEALPFVRFVPVDNAVAVRAVNFPEPCHPDPADRIIAASAMLGTLPLVTKDQRLHALSSISCVW